MSSLQVTNIYFDENANNGILYNGSSGLNVKLGGNNIVTLNESYFVRTNTVPGLAFNQANAAFNAANNAVTDFSPAYNQANTAYNQANAAFNAANAASITVINDSADTTRFLTFTANTSGSAASLNVSNTRLTFNPSTGTLSATIFNSLSDQSLKDNVVVIENAVETIKKIDGVSFNWKDNGNKSYGVIAQELEKILPDLVDQSEGIKNVNYSGIIAFLIQAVKELDAKIESK